LQSQNCTYFIGNCKNFAERYNFLQKKLQKFQSPHSRSQRPLAGLALPLYTPLLLWHWRFDHAPPQSYSRVDATGHLVLKVTVRTQTHSHIILTALSGPLKQCLAKIRCNERYSARACGPKNGAPDSVANKCFGARCRCIRLIDACRTWASLSDARRCNREQMLQNGAFCSHDSDNSPRY